MRNVATIGILIGALAVAVLPARADDQAISFATGQLGGSAWPAQTDNQQTQAASWQRGLVQRSASRRIADLCPRVMFDQATALTEGGCPIERHAVQLTREELYEKMWSRPAISLADGFFTFSSD